MPADDAVVDLLGALAYAELAAFDHLADDARLAPTLAGRAEMSAMASLEFDHHRRLAEHLAAGGHDPAAAMTPFVAAIDTFHTLTTPATWLEGVVKASVGDGMAADFYREIAAFVDDSTGELIRAVLADERRAAFAQRVVQEAVAEHPEIAGRLALWARRLVGEAISQTQHALADRDSLTRLLVEGTGDLAGVAALIGRITARHEERMTALGLSR